MRTLPLAVAPIVLGSASADLVDRFDPLLAGLALLVALLLQIGVNYANDYSDGIRGTDANRVGPLRLTGSGLVRPQAVKFAAAITFGLAALAGLTIVLLTGQWWLVAVGAEVRKYFPKETLNATIPRSVRLSEAPSFGQTAISYDPKNSGSLAYQEAAIELAQRGVIK